MSIGLHQRWPVYALNQEVTEAAADEIIPPGLPEGCDTCSALWERSMDCRGRRRGRVRQSSRIGSEIPSRCSYL